MDDKLEEIFGDEVENRSMEVYDEMVTAMAGSIYSELEKLIGDYGQGAVTGLMPLLVTVLESLEVTCAQAREREEQLELVQEDKQRLLIQYERERDGRKRSEERCMEMEDGIEQERKLYKANLLTMEAQTKNMEMKARSYADQIVGLEDQRAQLTKELSSLTQVHTKVMKNYKELRSQRSLSMEAGRLSGRNTPLQGIEKKMLLLDFQEAPLSLESVPDNECLESPNSHTNFSKEDMTVSSKTSSDSLTVAQTTNEAPQNHDTIEDELTLEEINHKNDQDSTKQEIQTVVDDIINSTPELKLNPDLFEASIPLSQPAEEQEEAQRNNDSLFDEFYKTSPEFISDVDEGADMSGIGNPVEALMMENTQLRDAQTEIDMARKSLIARVEELTVEREALKHENESLTQSLSRCESRLRETEQDLQRSRLELDEARKMSSEDAEVDVPAAQRKRFTRAEMARVLMERNQYKEKLMELQDAVRRTEMLRASKDVQAVQMKKSSFWKVFDRLFSSSGGPQGKVAGTATSHPASDRVRSPSTVMYQDGRGSFNAQSQSMSFHAHSTSHTDGANTVSARGKKYKLYRQIRSHIWSEHGKAQLHGWSLPPSVGKKSDPQGTAENEMKGFPVLVQLRLLDQKDPSTKLWCATGIDPLDTSSAANKNNDRIPSLVWICSGTHSASEMMVIDASSGNHVMDQFVIPNTHVLCVTSVPAYRLHDLDTPQTEEGDDCFQSSKEATVWLGTQEGSLFLHSAHSCWRNCIQKTQLKDAIYSITYASDRVIASLGDGTLAIFNRNAERKWDLENPKVTEFGRPQQSIRCCVAVQNEVWCGYRNRIYVVDPRTAKIKKWFEATPRTESQVRHLASAREGVWVSVRLDSILRLLDAQTGQPLQELELEPFIHKMLGSSNLGISMAQVSAMSIFCDRLFVGTTSGVILSIPFSREQTKHCTEEDKSQEENVPHRAVYCSIEYAQVCFHGHRDAVKFFACVPGCINPSSSEGNSKSIGNSSVLVMSGGEGYINFKIGDEMGDTDEGYGELLLPNPRHRRSERSHLIVWQMQT